MDGTTGSLVVDGTAGSRVAGDGSCAGDGEVSAPLPGADVAGETLAGLGSGRPVDGLTGLLVVAGLVEGAKKSHPLPSLDVSLC